MFSRLGVSSIGVGRAVAQDRTRLRNYGLRLVGGLLFYFDLGDGTTNLKVSLVSKTGVRYQQRAIFSDTNSKGGREQTQAAMNLLNEALVAMVFFEIQGATPQDKRVCMTQIQTITDAWNYWRKTTFKHNLILAIRDANVERDIGNITRLFRGMVPLAKSMVSEVNRLRSVYQRNAQPVANTDFRLSLDSAADQLRRRTLPEIKNMLDKALKEVIRQMTRPENPLRHNGINFCAGGNGVKSYGVQELLEQNNLQGFVNERIASAQMPVELQLEIRKIDIPDRVAPPSDYVGLGASLFNIMNVDVDPRSSHEFGFVIHEEGVPGGSYERLTPDVAPYRLPLEFQSTRPLLTHGVRKRVATDPVMKLGSQVMDLDIVHICRAPGFPIERTVQRVAVEVESPLGNDVPFLLAGTFEIDHSILLRTQVGNMSAAQHRVSLVTREVGQELMYDPEHPPEDPETARAAVP
jgi:hypothetical protein